MDNWEEQEIDYSKVKETGLVHIFDPKTDTYYPAVAYPYELGELKHIYQNNVYMFDLIDLFTKTTFVRNGVRMYLYKFMDEVASNKDKFEFLWKDRQI